MKDKRLALIFNFKDAPDKLKLVASELRQAWIEMQKADQQADLWRLERSRAKEAYERLSKRFDKELDDFDPANLKDKTLKEVGANE